MRRMSIQTVNTRLSDLFKKYPNIIAKFNSLSQTRSKPKVQPSKKVVEPGSMLTHRVTSWQNHTNSLQQEVCATLQKLTQDSTNFLDLVQQQYRDRPEASRKKLTTDEKNRLFYIYNFNIFLCRCTINSSI